MRFAWIAPAALLVAGCFADVESGPCPEGTENCPCVELQCEQGLTCQDARCLPEAGTGAAGSTSLPATTGETGETSSAATTMAADTSSTVADTTDAGSTTTTTSASSDSSTSSTVCGDGVVDDTEACDGGPGCTDCTLDNYACNPLNNAPCVSGTKCSLFDDVEGIAATECRPFLEPPPGQLYESNCYDFVPRDDWCDLGLACVTSQSTDACDVNCCVEYCDRLDPDFTCAFEGDTCQSALGGGAPSGLEWLGVCVTP